MSGVSRFDLQCDRLRRAPRAYAGSVIPISISENTRRKVQALAHAHKSTPFMVLATAFKILWLRYTGETDICIGTNIAGREDTDALDVVGLFTNTVALRTELSGNPTFEEALRRVRTTALEAYEYQLPFPVVVDAVKPPREPSRSPFFDVMLVLQNVPQRMKSVLGLEAESVPFHNGTCKFDMELTLTESVDGALVGQWEYDTELFDGRTIEQFSRHYTQLLESAVEAPAERVSRLRMISADEQAALLGEWNQTDVDFGIGRRGLWDLFMQEAEMREAAPAVISAGGSTRTYGELARGSRALAARLLAEGLAPGDLVGVFCSRSEWYIQALLGIHACRAAFLPLDPSLPDSRLADIMRDARIRHVVTRKGLSDRLQGAMEPLAGRPLHKVLMDDLAEGTPEFEGPCSPRAELAYVIYTSGSTGKPKGAMVGRAGMLNHLYAKIRTLDMTDVTRCAFTAPLCFDISIWQCLAPLLAGGTVVVITDEEMMDLDALCKRLPVDRVTVLELVPSYLDVLLGHMESRAGTLPELRFMVATGERLPAETCRRWLERFPGIPVVNAYGPTECSDDVLQYVIREKPAPAATSIPVGYALPNTKVFVLDDEREPVSIGVVGEIYVGGVCVGLGYLNDPQRTAEAFVPNPFEPGTDAPLYRTGDLAMRRSDGAIDYLGRIDSQVKVHGARIELEEVEAVLRSFAGVAESAAVVDEDGNSLHAFVTRSDQDRVLDTASLREYALGRLPRYGVPSSFLLTDAIPKTASGKTDRSALRKMLPASAQAPPALARVLSGEEGTLPLLHGIWCRVLGREELSANQDFFDVGGDSLKAIRVASLAQNQGLPVTASDVFSHPTLDVLATYCDAALADRTVLAAPATSEELTQGERWFLEQDLPNASLCDNAFLLDLPSEIPAEAVEDAIRTLWYRHEGLRARFRFDQGLGWQRTVLPSSTPRPFSIVDLSDASLEGRKQSIVAERNRTTGKDGFLFRATLIDLGDAPKLLVIAHYLVCDLVSWQVLLDDLADALSSVNAPRGSWVSPGATKDPSPIELDSDEIVYEFAADETRLLLDAGELPHAVPEAILVAAAAHALARSQDTPAVTLAVGTHGRNVAGPRQDVSHVVRRFADPSLIEMAVSPGDSPESLLTRGLNTLSDASGRVPASFTDVRDPRAVVAVDYLGETPVFGHSEKTIGSVTPVARSRTVLAGPYSHELRGEVSAGKLVLRFRSAVADEAWLGAAQEALTSLRARTRRYAP